MEYLKKKPGAALAKKIITSYSSTRYSYIKYEDKIKVILEDTELKFRKALYIGNWNRESTISEAEHALALWYCMKTRQEVPASKGMK